MRNLQSLAIILSLGAFIWIAPPAHAQSTQPVISTLLINTSPDRIINRFDPDQAMGTTLDVLSHREIDTLYTPYVIQESLSAGWGPVSYRNNSELRMAAWHWTENGTWSDPANKNGYFTGSADLKAPLRYVLSYSLPHRGFATSGDAPLRGGPTSYWKSNPYLTSHFTGESDSLHPQWVIEDLKSIKPVTAVHIAWASPFATVYDVEYWAGRGSALDFDDGPKGRWKTFPNGSITAGKGGDITLKLSDAPISTRFVRVLMTESSNTPDTHDPSDIRNCVGYAITSVAAGTTDAAGSFTDAAPTTRSANAAARRGRPSWCVSSIDPWHGADDAVARGNDQHSGLDVFFTSGLTNNLPAMIPITMLYGTPDDAANEIAYVERRGYPVSYVEMGEEPDGKHATPEDYGALYVQFAAAIHRVAPDAKLGGPIFEGTTDDITLWPDAQGRVSWLGRFIDYLKSHGRLSDLAFMSFEHYPFDVTNDPPAQQWENLYTEPDLMTHIMDVWRADGVPPNVPLMVTESSMAADITQQMSRVDAALWLCDSVGSFLGHGGAAYYHTPIQPDGRWSNFVGDANNITGYTAFYFAAHLMNKEWVQHRAGMHEMFPSSVDLKDDSGRTVITSYAVHRPDGNWALMLVNRDRVNPHTIRAVFEEAAKNQKSFTGPVAFTTFGSAQYVWHEDGDNSHPDPDGPPAATTLPGGPDATFTLPAGSVTILRGKF